jgi:flavin reductase (DIM6/NTAB) family NADH-FMN oxidoreductase RutF
MKHVNPKDVSIQEIQKYILGGVGPRPIALVSTLSAKGEANLSPFSFFNAFGANPPVIAFSASRRVRDGSFKDTYRNLVETKECVVQAVTYPMVEQVSLASTEYDTGVNEFIKSGLTPVASFVVKPSRVKESPFQMECILQQMINLGNGNGSGNLAICEVVQFHIADDIFSNGIIEPDLIDLVGRNSGDFYTRASGQAIFTVEKPVNKKGIGYDNLPEFIKQSNVYSANNLGKFANTENIPKKEDVLTFIASFEKIEATEELFFRSLKKNDHKKMLESTLSLFKSGQLTKLKTIFFIEQTAKNALENNDIDFAWKTALYANLI